MARAQAGQAHGCDPDGLTEQMPILRTELALVQARLDRIIAASSM
jgi:hypothetical protein